MPLLSCVLALATLWPQALTPPDGNSDSWNFTLPDPTDTHATPPLRAIALSHQKPEDVVERVEYRSKQPRYAQLQYGSPGSVRVTIVLDEPEPGKADLYVDANRNRRIEPQDRVDPDPDDSTTWRLPLSVAWVEGEETRQIPRALVFKRGRLTLSVSAAGYVEGRVELGGRSLPARRMDGDTNGTLTDSQDRLWIDLNQDGEWNPLSEQFAYSSILALEGERQALRSDPLGGTLRLEPLRGTGTITLTRDGPAGAGSISELRVTLVGRDGSAVGITNLDTASEVPIGDYRVHALTIGLDDPSGGPRWSFVFSDPGSRGDRGWFTVKKDDQVLIDPIGRLELSAGVSDNAAAVVVPGGDLSLHPKLYTGDGLLINTCYRGTPAMVASDSGPTAALTLESSDGQSYSLARSGFA